MSAQNPLPCGCRGELDLTYDDAQLVVRLARIRECPLHAAAGQLFEACKAFVAAENHDGTHLAYTMARAAIAKAEVRA